MTGRGRVLAVVLALAVVLPGVAGAAAVGEPALSVALSDNQVGAGESALLSLTVANEGEPETQSLVNPESTRLVTTARGVTVSLGSGDAPLTVETRRQLVGGLPQGEVASLPFRVTVAEDAAPGTYELPVRIEYTYSSFVSDTTGLVEEETETLRTTVTVEVTDEARFEVVSASTDARAGETGDVSVTLRNVGSEAARESTVTLRSLNAGLLFGDAGSGTAAPNASQFAGAWAPGENRTFTYRVTAADTERQREYAVQAVVSFRDADGTSRQSRALALGVTPAAAPEFEVRDVAASLRVGERGTVEATVVNTGETTVEDAVVVLAVPNEGFRPRSVEYPVGDIAPGASATVAYEVDVSEAVADGPKQFSFRVRYDGGDDRARTSEPLTSRVAVEPEREPFELSAVEASFAPDTDNRFVVSVTNVGDETRQDVTLRLAPEPPFTSTAPQAYVGTLDPGETAEVAFELTVDEDAVESRHAVAVNVTSDAPDRDDVLDGPYVVAVVVSEEQEGPDDVSLIVVAALIAVLVLGAGWWWLRG